MADATLTITAETGAAKASLEELRGVAGELFAGITQDSERTSAAADTLAAAWQEQGVTLLQANDAAARLRPEVEALAGAQNTAATATEAHDFNLKSLSQSFLGTISAVTLLKANLEDLKPSLEALGRETRAWAESLGLSKDSTEILTNTVEMMVNPFTIVENLTANLKISAEALARALYDEASAADAASEAQRRKAGIMASVLSEQQKLIAEEQKGTESLDRRTEALWRQIEVEKQGGEVKKFYLDKLKGILDEYDRRGDTPPEKVAKLAAELGVLSGEQEKVAASADREAGAQAKVVEQQDKLIPQITAIAEGKREQAAATDEAIRALKEEVAALEAYAKAAQQVTNQAQEKAGDAAKRIAELESKPVLTLDELNELNDLKSQQVALDREAEDAAESAADAAFEYGAAQASLAENTDAANESTDYAAKVMAELDAATADYVAQIQAAGDATTSANEIIETVGENGERRFTNLSDAAGQYGAVLVQVGEDGRRSLVNAADAAERVPDALSDVAPAADKAGEALDSLNEGLSDAAGDEDSGLGKTAKDAETLNNSLERSAELMRLIRVEAQRLNIVFGGGGKAQ